MTQEVYVEPTAEQMRARLRQLEREENDEKAQRMAASQATIPPRNQKYDEKGDLIVKVKPSITLPGPSKEQIVAEHAEKYPYRAFDPNTPDPLGDALPEYARAGATLAPKFVPKPSLVLQPQPAQDPYGFKPAPPQDRPLSGADARAAELQLGPVIVRPTKPCKNCGDAISPAAGYHYRADGTPCILDAAFAAREGVFPVKK